MKTIRLIFSLTIIVLGLTFAGQSYAATFIVTKTADTNDNVCNADCSLREAIAAANAAASNDVIEFDAAVFGTPQTIVLNGSQLQISNNGTLSINGTGSSLLTIDGNQLSNIIRIESDATATINRLKITNGKLLNFGNGGGIINQLGNLTVNDSVITGNATGADGEGGGIYNCGGNVTINNSTFSNNTAGSQGGGGIASGDSCVSGRPNSLTINDSNFNTNGTTDNGGAIKSNSVLNITNTVINNNSAKFGGGITSGPDAVLTNVTITYNSASQIGGGISAGRLLTINDSNITNNSANIGGGLSFGDSSLITINNSKIDTNTANIRGGGIYNFRGTINLNNSTVNSNISPTGGGIYNDSLSNPFTANNSDISSNNGSIEGGGIYLSGGTFNLNNSTVYNNTLTNSTGEGGAGVYVAIAALNVTNSTINSNRTNKAGGGIFNRGTVNLTNATINNNRADGNGGGVFNFNFRTVNARNTIIADNTSATEPSLPDFRGTLTSQGYNLIENTAGATINGIATGNILGRDAQLLPIRIYGGTRSTVALQPTSPAIDAADPNNFPATDQRGIPRPQDGDLNGTTRPDIGAYERQLTFFTVTKTADTNDGICNADCSLREAINASAVPTLPITAPDNVIIFDASLFATPQNITLTLGELLINDNYGTQLIKGNGAHLLTISGNNQSRVISVKSDVNAAISGATITGGNGTGAVTNGTGGGIYISFRGTLGIADSVITGNTANSNFGGGGIFNLGTLYIVNSSINNNAATITGSNAIGGGGGINNFNATLTIENSIINHNAVTATGNNGSYGGGIYHFDGTLIINRSTIRDNTANIGGNTNPGGGGGIYNGNRGSIFMTDSTVNNNTAQGNGAGINNNNEAFLVATNSTVTNNSAIGETGIGGGLSNFGIINLFNATISHNTASVSGGGVSTGGISIIINSRNSIFADNTAGLAPDFHGVLTSQGYNLIENTNETTVNGTTTGNILGQDPKLAPLADNGGPTLTRALLRNSPAVDSADPSNFPTTDQRGAVRPKDGDRNGTALADIGAFERDPVLDNNTPFDFDGDGKTDISIFRSSVGEWWYLRSSDGGNYAAQFGNSTDKLVPADYTGDGKTDIAIFRPAAGEWFVLRSEDGSFYSFPFGTSGDVPFVGDFDNDNKADSGVFRPSTATWFIRKSSDGQAIIQQFGQTGDVPVPADYDGDGRTDIAIYRTALGQWWIQRSTAGGIAFQFGDSTDKPVQGDYTGDGKADVALFRPNTGEWFVLRSEDQSYYSFPFGTNTDIPAPGDYDGDGKFDATVFRPSTNTWYSQRTTAGTLIQSFGQSGDMPVPNAFVP